MQQKLEQGFYWVRYYYWTVGRFYGNGWQILGVERAFETSELHEIGDKIEPKQEYKLGINLKP